MYLKGYEIFLRFHSKLKIFSTHQLSLKQNKYLRLH